MKKDIIIFGIDSIVMVGKEEYREKKSDFTGELENQELIYHFSGKATVYFNSQTLWTEENTIRYLPKGQTTKYVVDRITKGECIDIRFSANVLLSDVAFVTPAVNKKLSVLFKKIFSVWIKKEQGYYYKCISILYDILSKMQSKQYIPEKQFQYIKPAINYIENHFTDKNINPQKLESLCGISYSYIKKIFLLKYNTSPKKYVLLMKMNHACELLRYGKHSVSQIAEMCGYDDVYTFSHQFKIYIGVSPTNFVKKYKSSK